MAYNFIRKYELYLGTPSVGPEVFTKTPKETAASNPSQAYYTDIVPSKAVKITKLQFKAKIERTSKGSSSNSDSTVFEILNMSSATRKFAEQEGALIILKAGYENSQELPILYAGQIKSVRTERRAPSVITRIVAGDAYIPQKNSRISKYYSKTTSKAAIIKDLALSLQGVGEGAFALESLENVYFKSGYSASGKVTEVLSRLCRSLRLEYVIENNRVYIFPKTLDSNSAEYRTLSQKALTFSSNQILSGSGKMNDNTKDLSNQSTTKAGYLFRVFLNGKVKVASYVQVSDGTMKGIYKVVGVTHTLDFRGKSWQTEIQTEAVS